MRHSTFLEINLGYLQENIQKIKKLAPKAKVLPMVKADAYGNGIVPITKHLVEECEINRIGCATLGEALHIFNQCPDLNTELMVFSDTEIADPEMAKIYANYAITPVLHLKSDVEAVLKNPELNSVPLMLKVDTGMSRLGMSLEELSELAPKLKGRGVKHLMTHFACSYYTLKDGDKTHRQMENFRKAQQILKDAGVEVRETSVSNSGAIEQKFAVEETFVRPGLMMYGPYSVEPRIWEGHQISRLQTKVLKTFSVKKGTPVGYGINVAGEDGFIAILPIGYADLSLSTISGAEVTLNGYKGKFFARVNMDMTFIMFDPTVAGKIKTGEIVEIWNHDNRVITELATQMKTIPYQMMCGLTNRIPRIYKVR